MSAVTCGSVCETLESEVSVAINEAQRWRVVLHPKQGFPKAPPVRKAGQSWEKRGDLCDLSSRIIRQNLKLICQQHNCITFSFRL